MYAPIRAGTRGGQGDFKWSDVKEDEQRENYLGHSINAPKGRWQNGKDITWYLKDKGDTSAERAAEIKRIKEAEEDALAIALGFEPTPRAPAPPPVDSNQAILDQAAKEEDRARRRAEKEQRRAEKEDRRKERHEKKRATGGREKESGEKSAHHRRHRHRDRSHSPSHDDKHRSSRSSRPTRSRSRSRSPIRRPRSRSR